MTYKPAAHKTLDGRIEDGRITLGNFLYDRHWPFEAAFIKIVVLMMDDDDDDN
jgi:hypothetical protein